MKESILNYPKLYEENFFKIVEITETQIVIDIRNKDFLTTREIKILKLLTEIGKEIKIINANDNIDTLLAYLNYDFL